MNVAILGANRGIGLAFARLLVDQGERVYAFCRKASDELNALACEKIIEGFDVTALDKQNQKISELNAGKFDWVVCFSGIMFYKEPDDLCEKKMIEQFHVNAMGPVLTIGSFLPFLSEGSKIGIVSSRMGSITDNSTGGYIGFRMSKSALNMAGKCLSVELKEKGVGVFLLHPGFVKTEITHYEGDIEPSQAALNLQGLLGRLQMAETGRFWHAEGYELPW